MLVFHMQIVVHFVNGSLGVTTKWQKSHIGLSCREPDYFTTPIYEFPIGQRSLQHYPEPPELQTWVVAMATAGLLRLLAFA